MLRVLRSNGETELRAYVVTAVPQRCGEPVPSAARVEILDPRTTPTVQGRPVRRGPAPRNPELTGWPAPSAPLLDLPDGLPATKTQRVIVAPELIAQWREEARNQGES